MDFHHGDWVNLRENSSVGDVGTSSEWVASLVEGPRLSLMLNDVEEGKGCSSGMNSGAMGSSLANGDGSGCWSDDELRCGDSIVFP